MITLKDAELQINALKRELESLRREIKNKVAPTPDSNSIKNQIIQYIQQGNEVDSVLNVDKTTVIHKLLHIFSKLKTEDLIVTAGTTNFENINVNHNIFAGDLISTNDIIVLNINVTTSLIAEDATINNDLTVNHDVIVTNDLTVNNNEFIINDLAVGNNLNITNDLTIGNSVTVLGVPGLTESIYSVIKTSTPNTVNLQYKDWAGANQTAVLMIGLNQTVANLEFLNGIRI